MELLDQCLRQAALYPRWLVVTSVVLSGIATLWIVAKLFKWAVNLLLALIVVALVGGLMVWWML
jgi:hypothetical protein